MTITDTFLLDHYAPHGKTAGTLSAEDRLDIAELADRFDWAVDTRRYENLADLFTTDGVVDHDWGYMDGSQQIVETIKSHRPDEQGVRHLSLGKVITSATPGEAQMVSFLLAFRVGGTSGQEPGGQAPYIIAHGVQHWDLRQIDGRWLVQRLTLDQTAVSGHDAPPEVRDAVAMTADARAEASGRPTAA